MSLTTQLRRIRAEDVLNRQLLKGFKVNNINLESQYKIFCQLAKNNRWHTDVFKTWGKPTFKWGVYKHA